MVSSLCFGQLWGAGWDTKMEGKYFILNDKQKHKVEEGCKGGNFENL